MASSSNKKTGPKKKSDKVVVNDDVLDAEVVATTEDAHEAVDEKTDVDGAANDEPPLDESPLDNEADETLDTVTEITHEVPVPVVTENKAPGVFLPMVLGGIVAAGIGYFVAQYSGAQGVTIEQVSKLSATIDDQGATIDEQGATIDQQGTLISSLSADLKASTAQIGSLNDVNASQDTLISELIAKIDARPAPTGDVELPADLAALLQEQKDEISSLQGDLKDMAKFAEGQIQTAQEKAEAAEVAQARAKARDGLNTVRLALASGEPFGDVLGEISGAVDVPETLSAVADGVPTQSSLQNEFGAFSRNALAASNRELSGDSTSERVGLFFKDIVGSRSLTPQEGDSPNAVLSRVEASVKNGDLDGALKTIDELPESGKAALNEWSEKAQARSGALAAFSELNAALSAD